MLSRYKIRSNSGAVSISGAGPDLWAVKGGNKLIPEGLINISNARVNFSTQITKIWRDETKFRLGTENPLTNLSRYDAVVIAAPVDKNLKFGQLPIRRHFPKFLRVYVYLLTGELSDEFSRLTDIWFCCAHSNLHAISLIKPVDGSEPSKILDLIGKQKQENVEIITYWRWVKSFK